MLQLILLMVLLGKKTVEERVTDSNEKYKENSVVTLSKENSVVTLNNMKGCTYGTCIEQSMKISETDSTGPVNAQV